MDYGMEMDIDRFNIEDENEIENPIQDKLDDAVLDIFQQLRDKPFRNATQRKEMVSYLTQLLLYDTIEVRRLFREIGKLLNDLADNGLIDGSADYSMEESTKYVPYFEETAEKFGLMKESDMIDYYFAPDGTFWAYDNYSKIAGNTIEGTPRYIQAQKNPKQTAKELISDLKYLINAGHSGTIRSAKEDYKKVQMLK